MALSEAQIKANEKWNSKNKERKKYLDRRSGAKSFIKNLATIEDLEVFEEIIKERREYFFKKI